jgi:hypothetical protein
VPDKIVLQEVVYQTIIHGGGGILYWLNKAIFPPFPLYVGNYFFGNIDQAQVEVNTMLSYHFREERYRIHDPKNTVRGNFNKIGLHWENTTNLWEEE